jgi:hypothetical protein
MGKHCQAKGGEAACSKQEWWNEPEDLHTQLQGHHERGICYRRNGVSGPVGGEGQRSKLVDLTQPWFEEASRGPVASEGLLARSGAKQ